MEREVEWIGYKRTSMLNGLVIVGIQWFIEVVMTMTIMVNLWMLAC